VRVPVSWLRDYVAVEEPIEELAERLSMTGTKVEAIHRRGVPDGLELYRIGRVVSRDRHPNADRLSLCRVDVGEGEPRQIVCGASNFSAGATVAVALPGAVLPDGNRLQRARLRGVESDGMMLSERELELSAEHDGIMLLPETWPVGAALAEHLPIAETVLELEVTSNRPDCQSVYGVAREVSAIRDRDLAPWPGREPEALGEGRVEDLVRARIEAPELCPRWAGRVFTGVRVGPSPPWLKARIAAAGMRSISNVVDITNYVMLCLGEPTHAFDLDLVAGREIVVRRAAPGEPIVTLDGQRRELDPGMLVIADAEKPSAIAGLMGSEWSEVRPETTTVLLECANFDAFAVQRASARLGLRTEGSSRWEKGVDAHLTPRALALASQLLVELCGARMVPGTVDLHGALPLGPVLPLRRERLSQVIGVDYEEPEVERILRRLGYEGRDGGWQVPTWRAGDTTREIDLVEEVARVAGLERVPASLPPHAEAIGLLTRQQRLARRVVEVLLGAGQTEAVTIPFVDRALLDRLRLPQRHPARDAVLLRNPLGPDQELMRTLLFPGLLTAVRRNVAVGAPEVALFEIGAVYRQGEGELPDQPVMLAAVLCGGEAVFQRLEGVLEVLHRALHLELGIASGEEPFLHPGRRAALERGGFLGELHPAVAEEFGIEQPIAVAELPLGPLLAASPAQLLYRDVIGVPPLRQDLAVVVDEETPAGDVIAAAREAAGPLLASARAFDVYRGPQLGERRKSLAVHLVFQSPERTLSEEEVAPLRERILAALTERFGAELRA
jgi:phenylalanyl-tRNA synthetase beta chain